MEKKLVSISVITYNSSKYIIDTLESVKAQTYSPLELIVSDDCSTDNTVEICKKWIEENKDRFVNTKTIVAPKNQGISANYNQGMDNCTGDYIKEVAGDDILLPNCVEDYVQYVTEHPESYFCFGRAVVFDGDEERRKNMEQLLDYSAFDLSPKQQLEKLYNSENFICSAAYFYNRNKAKECGIRNDERIPFMEDMPKWINILEAGNKLCFLDKEVVKFRCSSTSLSTQHKASMRWLQQFALFTLYYAAPYKKKFSRRKAWRMQMYAMQELYPRWYRACILRCYEFCANVIRK